MWSWQKTWCQLPGISSGWKCRWSCIPDCKTLGRGTVKSVSRSPGFALTYLDILVYWLLAILTIRPWSAVVVLALWQVSCDFSVTKEASTWQARWICLAHLLGHCRLFLISNSCCSRRHSGKMSLGWPKQSRLEPEKKVMKTPQRPWRTTCRNWLFQDKYHDNSEALRDLPPLYFFCAGASNRVQHFWGGLWSGQLNPWIRYLTLNSLVNSCKDNFLGGLGTSTRMSGLSALDEAPCGLPLLFAAWPRG